MEVLDVSEVDEMSLIIEQLIGAEAEDGEDPADMEMFRRICLISDLGCDPGEGYYVNFDDDDMSWELHEVAPMFFNLGQRSVGKQIYAAFWDDHLWYFIGDSEREVIEKLKALKNPSISDDTVYNLP